MVKLERIKEEHYKLCGWIDEVSTVENLKELEIEL